MSVYNKNQHVGILNIGIGNYYAVAGAIKRLGITPLLVKEPNDLKKVSHLIIPGVGEMSYFINRLKYINMFSELQSFASDKFIFGICLGFQALYDYSEEGNTECLGILKGIVRPISNIFTYATHVGYARLITRPSVSKTKIFLCNIDKPYYFVHSYYLPELSSSKYLTSCGQSLITAVASNGTNVFGSQFHPELSHSHGREILREFINLS